MSENYYILLGLSPEIDDWAVIEPAITDSQRRWAMQRNQGTPSAQRKAGHNLRLIPDMRVKLQDPVERKIQAKEAKRQLKSQKEEQLVKLNGLIGMIQGDVIESKRFKSFVKKFPMLAEAEIEAQLKLKGITLVPDGKQKPNSSKTSPPKLPRTTAKSIRDNLQHIGLKNLYEFLGLGKRSSPDVLYSKADEIYKELHRKGLIDPDSTTRKELAGHSKAVFKDKLQKERYDNSYKDEAMEGLNEHLEVAGWDSILDKNDIDKLLREARERGVDQDSAMEYIREYAEKREWVIQESSPPPINDLKQCGFCDALARKPEDTRCHNCGQELIQACPRCGQPTPTQDECCGACGCSTGDAPFIQGLLKEGRTYIAQGDLPKARQCFEQALVYWENWEPAVKELQRIKTLTGKRESAFDSVRQLLSTRKLEEARSQLEGLKREFGAAGTEDLTTRIDTGIKRAESTFRTAATLLSSGRKEEAVEKLLESLNHCKDFQPALSKVRTLPPSAPSKLAVEIKGTTAQLRWNPAKAKGDISYIVQRKPLGVPGNSDDGTRLKEVHTCEYQDTSIKPGTPWYYSVFARRGNVFSVEAASSGPHLMVADPTAINVEPSNRQVSIKWTPPAGCKHVEVWRREKTAPAVQGSGVKLTVSGNSVIDQGLENGATYGYLIIACFADPVNQQRVLYSSGIGITSTPVAPPSPVEDLAVKKEGAIVRLSWTPISRGNVQIRQTRKVPSASVGKVIALADAKHYGEPVAITGDGMAQTTPNSQGRVFFVPLSVVEQTAVLGKPVSITTLDEVSNVTTRRESDRISLRWRWPPGAAEVFVNWRDDDYPQSPEADNASGQLVTRKEYEREDSWTLHNAPRSRHYFTLFVYDSGSGIYSSGVRALDAAGIEIRVKYRVEKRYSLRRFRRVLQEVWVALETDTSVASLPAIQVVIKPGAPPISSENGSMLLALDHLDFDAGNARIDLPTEGVNGYIKLFFKNTSDAQAIRLMPADQKQLKLG